MGRSNIVNRKSLLKPWVTPSLVRRLKIRDNLGKLASKGRINRKTYTDFRNKVTKQLRELKATHYNSEFENSKGSIKSTWDIINTCIKKRNLYQKVSLCDNESIIKAEDIPNKFIDYLSNIPEKLVSELPNSNTNVNSYLRKTN